MVKVPTYNVKTNMKAYGLALKQETPNNFMGFPIFFPQYVNFHVLVCKLKNILSKISFVHGSSDNEDHTSTYFVNFHRICKLASTSWRWKRRERKQREVMPLAIENYSKACQKYQTLFRLTEDDSLLTFYCQLTQNFSKFSEAIVGIKTPRRRQLRPARA